ncbi:hypothetical protein [Streptomyces sp. NPDC049944]|uniref:hypothetical protein n=1 Tax=Streptomyces sp. NPDC049944 TaxID=3155657 RepID=UPI00342BE03C
MNRKLSAAAVGLATVVGAFAMAVPAHAADPTPEGPRMVEKSTGLLNSHNQLTTEKTFSLLETTQEGGDYHEPSTQSGPGVIKTVEG